MEMLISVAKINLYWIVLFCFYQLLLRRQTFFRLNRLFLLFALIVTPALVMIEFTETVVVQGNETNSSFSNISSAAISNAADQSMYFDWSPGLFAVYVFGATIMLFAMLRAFYVLYKTINEGEHIRFENFTVVLLPAEMRIGSFSFFKYMVVSHHDYEHCFELVMQHENAHIQQRHSFDILLVEILKVVFWFNPVLIFYKKAFREVHEYLADQEIVERDMYATFLVAYAKENAFGRFVNHFYNASLLKSRIRMLYQNPSSRWSYMKYLLVIPVLAGMVMLTAARVRTVIAEHPESVPPILESKSTLAKEIKLKPARVKAKKMLNTNSFSQDTIPDKGKSEKKKFMNYRYTNAYTTYESDSVDITQIPKKFWTSSPAIEQAMRDREKVDELAPLTFPTNSSFRYTFNHLFADSTNVPKTKIHYGGFRVSTQAWPYPPVRINKNLKIVEP